MIQSKKLALVSVAQPTQPTPHSSLHVVAAERDGERTCGIAHPHIARLHAAKDRIGRCDRQAWVHASRQSNPHEELIGMLKATLHGGIICRAEAKMWELMHQFPSFLRGPEGGGEAALFKAVHVADAPGGFANATLRRCDAKGINHGGWVGMTLRGTEGALAYDPSLDMARAELFWGADGTGDLTSARNLESLFDAHGGTADLFTADGGFDTHDAPELQEAQSAPLILAEAVAAIGCCRQGGNAVIKVFECITPMSLSILTLLAMHFKEVKLVKPLTSRPANSERYIVCLSRRKEKDEGVEGEEEVREEGESQNTRQFSDLVQLVPMALQFGKDGVPWRLSFPLSPDQLLGTEAAFSLRQAIAIERVLAAIDKSCLTPGAASAPTTTDAQKLRLKSIVEEWLR